MKTGIVLSLFIAIFNIVPDTRAHGDMVWPINWFDYKQWVQTGNSSWKYDYVGMKAHQQCAAGFQTPREIICPKPDDCDGFKNPGVSCVWFNNYTFVEKPTLFDPKLRTYAHNEYPSFVLHHPWRAPGSAPIYSPCGVAG